MPIVTSMLSHEVSRFLGSCCQCTRAVMPRKNNHSIRSLVFVRYWPRREDGHDVFCFMANTIQYYRSSVFVAFAFHFPSDRHCGQYARL